MSRTERILVFDNEIEARLLSEILNEKKIPHMIRSFHDSVYDGLFQVQAGWGILEAPEEYRDEILKVYKEMSPPQTGNESF